MGIVSLWYSGGMTASGITLLGLAIVNSIGYACGMSLGQNQFLDSYNTIYAEKMSMKEIDSNASAGPMKILQNAANVVGLVLGGFFLQIFHYPGFFLLFGGIIIAVSVWSYRKRGEIHA
jgi:hypothetical protein